jgi:hypothetical protein
MPRLQDHRQAFRLLLIGWLRSIFVIEGTHSFGVLLHSFFEEMPLYLESILMIFV